METTANQRLKNWAESEKISAKHLADAMEVSRQSVYDIFNNRTKVTAEHLAKIKLKHPTINRYYVLFGTTEKADTSYYPGEGGFDLILDESILSNTLEAQTKSLDWKEEAFKAVKEENTFLKKQLELLNNVVNTLLKNPNFLNSPLQAAKFIELQGALAGDYKLAA